MSLDVHLYGPETEVECICQCCDHRHMRKHKDELYWRNITHNLVNMADAAGIYKACWRPEENGIERAEQLIPLLEDGLKQLESDPSRFEQFNPKNGWGSYDSLVNFVREYLTACRNNPQATIWASR